MSRPAATSAAGFVLALAMAGPATARGLPDDLKPRSQGVPATAIAAPGGIGRGNAGALDEGRALLMGNNPAQALSAFQVALAQSPQSVAALNGIAIAYDRLGRSDLARQHFEMALALEPDAADIIFNLGLALVRVGQDRAAIPHLQRAAAGNDVRVAAAARRSLVQISARLTTPVPDGPPAMTPVMPAAATGPRIDMASSGEAVLVLGPTPAAPASAARPAAAPVRLAEAVPAAIAQAPIEARLAARLGDAAALIIPINLPEPTPEEPEMPLPAAVDRGPLPAPRRVVATAVAPSLLPVPVSIPAPSKIPAPAPPPAAMPATMPAVAHAMRHPSAPVVLAQWRRADPADAARQAAVRPAPAPLHDDDKAAIRLAIARLESLVSRIEVQRG